MLLFKCLLPFLIVSFIQGCYSKPTDNAITEGRGIGYTIWGYITYPFSWWGSSDPTDTLPAQDQLVTATIGPYDNIQIASLNVTIWCNDHTCTTMKCDKNGCVNNTCSIYDTDVNGQCREYNTNMKPEEPIPSKPTEPAPSSAPAPAPGGVTDAAAEVTSSTTTTSAQTEDNPAVEHPLELEAALSSTVTKTNVEAAASGDKVHKSSPQNKI